MSNPWFRLYAEFATDPKVQMLSEVDQRRFLMLLCLRCCNGDVTLHDTEVAFQLRIADVEWATTKGILIERGLLSSDGKIAKWDKRQFLSDSSVARVRRFRAKHKTKPKRPCNVTVTPPDTDTDTDTDKKNQKKKQPRASLAAMPAIPDWLDPEAWAGFDAMRRKLRFPMTPRAAALVLRELAKHRETGADPNAILDQSTRNGWRDVFAIRPDGGSHARSRQPTPSAADRVTAAIAARSG